MSRTMMRIVTLAVAVLSLLTGPVLLANAAPPFDPTAFAIRAQELMDGTAVPGMAVAVVQDGAIVHLQGYGVAGPDGRPVTGQTPFAIGSVTKSMTALVILQLAAEGELNPADPVVKYLPGFRTADKALSDQITIEDLVTHRSGLSTLAGNRHGSHAGQRLAGPADAVADLADEKLADQPGASFRYSNANYAVLTRLIEVLEGEDFEAVLTRRLFQPLGLRHSFVGLQVADATDAATGYRSWFGLARPTRSGLSRRLVGAGGVVASSEDMARYLIALQTRDPRVVPTGAERLFQGRTIHGVLGYAYGWNVYSDPEGHLIYHSGAVPGFSSLAAMLPGSGRSVVVLTNYLGMLGGNLAQAVTHEALGLEPVDPGPSMGARMALWSSVGGVLGILLWLGKTVRRLFFAPQPMRPWVRWLNVGAVLALVGGVVAVPLLLPGMLGLSLGTARLFFPDMVQILFAGCALALLLAAARLVILIRDG